MMAKAGSEVPKEEANLLWTATDILMLDSRLPADLLKGVEGWKNRPTYQASSRARSRGSRRAESALFKKRFGQASEGTIAVINGIHDELPPTLLMRVLDLQGRACLFIGVLRTIGPRRFCPMGQDVDDPPHKDHQAQTDAIF